MFRKVAAVAMVSLLSLSGTAFASTSKIAEVTRINRLGNAEIIVAQGRVYCQGYLRYLPAFARSAADAESTLGNALVATQSEAIRGSKKGVLMELIAKAISLIDKAYVLSCSDAISDKKAVAKLLAEAETILDDALAIAQSGAISGPGKPAIARSLASAKTYIVNLAAIAQSHAQ